MQDQNVLVDNTRSCYGTVFLNLSHIFSQQAGVHLITGRNKKEKKIYVVANELTKIYLT